MNIFRAIAEVEGLHDRLLDGYCFLIQLERVGQHHGRRGNRRNWIRHILPGNVRRAAVDRLEQSNLRANTGRRQHADGAGQHRGFIAQNVT